jgi:hypothetical protein
MNWIGKTEEEFCKTNFEYSELKWQHIVENPSRLVIQLDIVVSAFHTQRINPCRGVY